MTPALIMLVIPGLPSYNGVEVYYLKGVIGLPIVISFRDRWCIHIFFLEMGLLMTSSSSAGAIQISKFPEPCCQHICTAAIDSQYTFTATIESWCTFAIDHPYIHVHVRPPLISNINLCLLSILDVHFLPPLIFQHRCVSTFDPKKHVLSWLSPTYMCCHHWSPKFMCGNR